MEDVAKGTAKGVLEHTEERIAELVRRFRNREVAFVEDKSSVEVIKRERESAEYKMMIQYVPKGWLRILFQVGLSLREMEGNQNKVTMLKDDIYGKFGTAGVHIAELTQRGIITQLIAHLVKILGSPADVRAKLVAFLDQVDYLTMFVTKADSKVVESKYRLIVQRVENNPTHMMILFGSGYAKSVLLNILKRVKEDSRKYLLEVQEEGLQLIAFVFAPELKGKLTHWSDPLAGKK